MIFLWVISAAILAVLSIISHTLATRWLNPSNSRRSMLRFWALFSLRLGLIGLFFWQLVQQGSITLIFGFVVFLTVYAGSLYFIINRKPQWFQHELKKETPVWMQ